MKKKKRFGACALCILIRSIVDLTDCIWCVITFDQILLVNVGNVDNSSNFISEQLIQRFEGNKMTDSLIHNLIQWNFDNLILLYLCV